MLNTMIGSHIANIIIGCPSTLTKLDVNSLNGHDWFRILNTHPHLAKFCNFEKFNKTHWIWLIKTQPALINYINPVLFSKQQLSDILLKVPLFI